MPNQKASTRKTTRNRKSSKPEPKDSTDTEVTLGPSVNENAGSSGSGSSTHDLDSNNMQLVIASGTTVPGEPHSENDDLQIVYEENEDIETNDPPPAVGEEHRKTARDNTFDKQFWKKLGKVPKGFNPASINFTDHPMLKNFLDPVAARQEFLECLADYRALHKKKMMGFNYKNTEDDPAL